MSDFLSKRQAVTNPKNTIFGLNALSVTLLTTRVCKKDKAIAFLKFEIGQGGVKVK